MEDNIPQFAISDGGVVNRVVPHDALRRILEDGSVQIDQGPLRFFCPVPKKCVELRPIVINRNFSGIADLLSTPSRYPLTQVKWR